MLAFVAGQSITANLAVLQVRDVADALVHEIYVRGADRQICLWSPAGGLRSTSVNLCSGIALATDGTPRRIEVSAQVNSSVVVRIDGVDLITVTGLTGGTTGLQRTVRVGIDHYDGSSTAQVRVVHSQVAVSTVTWVGP